MQGRLPLVFLKRAQVEHIITNSPPSVRASPTRQHNQAATPRSDPRHTSLRWKIRGGSSSYRRARDVAGLAASTSEKLIKLVLEIGTGRS